jgi:signal transduction histidine kinase
MPPERPVTPMPTHPAPAPVPAPPWDRLRAHLLARAGDLTAAGHGAEGAALLATVEAWWEEQQQWNGSMAGLLSVHHEINNALVGVSGNAQLLLMGPAGQLAGVRERLEVVMRESQRIRDAALQLRHLRTALGPANGTTAEPTQRPMRGAA